MIRLISIGILVFGGLGFLKASLPPDLDSRIVGGSAVNIEQHPHQLSLQTISHICGASVISNRWVITAAHCTRLAAQNYVLMAGSNNTRDGKQYYVKRIVQHPSYNYANQDYDVAVVETEEEITFNARVQPIKLAEMEPTVGALVNVTGWGALRQGGSVSPALMKVSVPIVPREKCSLAYKGVAITERMICAGYLGQGGKDSCQGDSGGPLTLQNVLHGIVSWGYGCAHPNYPGVYTNVASVRNWINEVTGI